MAIEFQRLRRVLKKNRWKTGLNWENSAKNVMKKQNISSCRIALIAREDYDEERRYRGLSNTTLCATMSFAVLRFRTPLPFCVISA